MSCGRITQDEVVGRLWDGVIGDGRGGVKSRDMVEERERERLQVLHRLEILDTEPEEAFDRVTDIAARFFQTPKATVTFVDRERQWFKSRIGIEVRETPRDIAFCSHTIRTDQVCLVPDATRDPRFTDN